MPGCRPYAARAAVAGDVLAMPEIGVTLPLADIYADVTLPEIEPG
jgi:hypothetical protein